MQEPTNPWRTLAELYAELGECWKTLVDIREEEVRYWREKAEFLELIAKEG